MAMQIPGTVPEQIEMMSEMEISYRTLHDYMRIINEQKNKEIIVPYESFTNEYRDFLETIIVEVELLPKEQIKYQYKPKTLSYDLYGTTEFWSDILILNRCYSLAMFRPETVRVYDPAKFKTFLNEIMILEENR